MPRQLTGGEMLNVIVKPLPLQNVCLVTVAGLCRAPEIPNARVLLTESLQAGGRRGGAGRGSGAGSRLVTCTDVELTLGCFWQSMLSFYHCVGLGNRKSLPDT